MTERAHASRLATLLRFLEQDPDNLRLIADAAAAAFDEGDCDRADALVARYRSLAEPPASLLNLEGLTALRAGRIEQAAAIFEALRAGRPDEPTVAANLAWARAIQGRHEEAAALLDEAVVAAVPRAAALKVQALHHLGRLEDALACGQGFAERTPDDQPLMGALALAALDADEIGLARFYSDRAGDDRDGLATRASLVLADDDPEGALALFERALAAAPDHARAQLGKGLALLARGDAEAASGWIDRGAEGFGDHVGSWIAAGWARFVAGDQAGARARFERALALDDSFSESQGALAVMDVVEGRIEEGRKRAEVALRLDRGCFSGALAKSLIAAQGGDAAGAERIRRIALSQPAGPDGRTIAQIAVGLGRGAGGRGRAGGASGAPSRPGSR